MKKPHVLIFNPDQWRGDVLGHMGNPAASTPVLDKCVREDFVSFRNAFCQNPVCTPSRCSFMTGWYPHVRGHRTMYHMLQPEEPCLLKILKDDGYHVWWAGKNDLIPGQNGFDDYSTTRIVNFSDTRERWGLTRRDNLHAHPDEWRGAPGSDTYYSFFAGKLDKQDETIYCDDDWARVLAAVDFIRSYAGDEPLCIYLPLEYPHPPYGVEDPWFSQIDRSLLPPRIPALDWEKRPAILPKLYERFAMQGWTEDRWDELRATYYGMCARVDRQFGMVLDALREKGFYDDTAVFFFSDHGDFTGDYGLVEKTDNTFADCLVNVPFLVKPPAPIEVQPGVNDALVELVDFSETVYEMCNLHPNYIRFGRSLVLLLTGEKSTHRDAVFCEGGRLEGESHANNTQVAPPFLYWPRVNLQLSLPEHSKANMVRTNEWKYVKRLGESDELYDLRRDPDELKNRIDDPECAQILGTMKDLLLTHLFETGDVVPFHIDSR